VPEIENVCELLRPHPESITIITMLNNNTKIVMENFMCSTLL